VIQQADGYSKYCEEDDPCEQNTDTKSGASQWRLDQILRNIVMLGLLIVVALLLLSFESSDDGTQVGRYELQTVDKKLLVFDTATGELYELNGAALRGGVAPGEAYALRAASPLKRNEDE